MNIVDETELEFDMTEYEFECWTCGTSIWLLTKAPALRVFCPDCKEEYIREKESTLKEYVRLKMLVMHERALRMLEKQSVCLAKYKEVSEIVLEAALIDPEKFASSHEMAAAMELIRNEIKIKMQQKIKNHRVDFIIPELFSILEIDGYMHEHKKIEDSKRDLDIRNELGEQWEIIRIPTKYIEKNIRALVTAIEELHKFKRKTRRENKGIIPSWYSDREKMHYAKILVQE